MIKSLRVSDKTVRRFKSAKTWNYSTIDSLSGLVLEQTKKDGKETIFFEAASLQIEPGQKLSPLDPKTKQIVTTGRFI